MRLPVEAIQMDLAFDLICLLESATMGLTPIVAASHTRNQNLLRACIPRMVQIDIRTRPAKECS